MSETRSDLEYTLTVDNVSLNGASTNIDQNGITVFVPYNETVEFPFEVYKSSSSSTYEYNDIKVVMQSSCGGENSILSLSAEFKKSCSKVSISEPSENWVFNKAKADVKTVVDETNNMSVTYNTFPINLTDFNMDFAGFNKIELEYRSASSPKWFKLESFYTAANLYDLFIPCEKSHAANPCSLIQSIDITKHKAHSELLVGKAYQEHVEQLNSIITHL